VKAPCKCMEAEVHMRRRGGGIKRLFAKFDETFKYAQDVTVRWIPTPVDSHFF